MKHHKNNTNKAFRIFTKPKIQKKEMVAKKLAQRNAQKN